MKLKRTMAALVFGNSAYPDDDDLDNPVNDAADLGAKITYTPRELKKEDELLIPRGWTTRKE
jgi:hypothetical protein